MIIQRIDLSEQIDLKKKLKQELDEIYRSAFDGPSPGKIFFEAAFDASNLSTQIFPRKMSPSMTFKRPRNILKMLVDQSFHIILFSRHKL